MQNRCVWIPTTILWTLMLGVGCRDANPTSDRDNARAAIPSGAGETASANVQVVPAKQTRSRDAESLTKQAAFVDQARSSVETFCGDCHAMPVPSSSSREEWVDEVNQGFVLYGESGRSDLDVPPYDDVLKFFQFQAPDSLDMPSEIQNYPAASVELRSTDVRFPGARPPGVTNVRWIDIGIHDAKALVYCDIGTGAVMAHWPSVEDSPTIRLATLFQPVHVETCDLDDDGWTDLVVADVGEFNAEDSDLGRVVWLRRTPDSEKFEKIVLLENVGRVADVRPGDFDGDGDADLLVGVFGWRKTGSILLLENPGSGDPHQLEFAVREIDERSGAVHLPPVDLNDDGALDFVALISQHHERVEAFINDGSGKFTTKLMWAAPDPAYGSSGIELVDLDRDGDLDVLYTNGDSFDRGPKPYHSIQWLENEGHYPYTHHHLCAMPGVLNATTGDFDGDGDLDVVGTSIVASEHIERFGFDSSPSIVMLVQVSPGKFEPSQIELGNHNHLSIESGDFDSDGKIDLAVGTFLREGGTDQPDLVLWWNES